jgi:hypothetical protein
MAKAITIKQPYASLIVEGIKDIENRTWKTNYRGKILIHAGKDNLIKNLKYGDDITCLNNKQLEYITNNKHNDIINNELTTGAIIGSVEIIDCVINHPSIWAEKSNELNIGDIVPYKNTRGNIKNAEILSFTTVDNGDIWLNGIDTTTKAKVWYPTHLSLEFMGIVKPTYNWVLANPIKFDKPIPIKGKLSLWETNLEECHICGEITNCNICQRCNNYYCDDCASKYNQFTQIDYSCCDRCANTNDK